MIFIQCNVWNYTLHVYGVSYQELLIYRVEKNKNMQEWKETIIHQRKHIHEPRANKKITSLSAAASMTMMNP